MQQGCSTAAQVDKALKQSAPAGEGSLLGLLLGAGSSGWWAEGGGRQWAKREKG